MMVSGPSKFISNFYGCTSPRVSKSVCESGAPERMRCAAMFV
jgi:hypothetical protein